MYVGKSVIICACPRHNSAAWMGQPRIAQRPKVIRNNNGPQPGDLESAEPLIHTRVLPRRLQNIIFLIYTHAHSHGRGENYFLPRSKQHKSQQSA